MSKCKGKASSWGRGQHSTRAGAIHRAKNHFLVNGGLACSEKSCSQGGGKCIFNPTEEQIAATIATADITGNDQVGWTVDIKGEGYCHCDGD